MDTYTILGRYWCDTRLIHMWCSGTHLVKWTRTHCIVNRSMFVVWRGNVFETRWSTKTLTSANSNILYLCLPVRRRDSILRWVSWSIQLQHVTTLTCMLPLVRLCLTHEVSYSNLWSNAVFRCFWWDSAWWREDLPNVSIVDTNFELLVCWSLTPFSILLLSYLLSCYNLIAAFGERWWMDMEQTGRWNIPFREELDRASVVSVHACWVLENSLCEIIAVPGGIRRFDGGRDHGVLWFFSMDCNICVVAGLQIIFVIFEFSFLKW